MVETEIEIRPYRVGDEHGIVATFNRVFREVCGEEFVDRDLEFWRWGFCDCPTGQRIFVAVAPDGTIAAQYACVPHRVTTPRGDRTFLHTVDSMVHPEYRAGLKRPGLFVRTTLEFQAACRERGDALTYGYPVRSAERIGRRYLDYETIGVVDYLVRDLSSSVSAVPESVEVERVARFSDPGVLFERVAAEKSCLTVRDAEFLDWRFVRIPGDPYVRLQAHRAGELAGIAVVRPVHELIPGACTIADWIVPGDDDEVRDALIAEVCAIGREHSRRVLMTVFAESSAERAQFLASGFELEPSANTLERRMTVVHFGSELSNEWLREHWWFTLGDSDLV